MDNSPLPLRTVGLIRLVREDLARSTSALDQIVVLLEAADDTDIRPLAMAALLRGQVALQEASLATLDGLLEQNGGEHAHG